MAKTKDIDITKTGPAGYKALQQANAAPYTPATDEINRLRGRFKKQIDPYEDMPQPVASPLLSDKSRWGDSMWDEETATLNDFENLSDKRGENQWAVAKLGAGLTKGAVLAGTTFLNGTLGLAAGIGTAAAEGRLSGLWDNEVTNAMDSINKWSEEALPNYYTQEELDEPWYKNIFTANFWGDKFLKNLGFTVGAFYSGGIYSKGLSGLMKLINAGRKTTGAVTSLVGAGISAVNEGSIEALNAANDYESKMMPMIEQQYQDNVTRAQKIYELTGDVNTYNATLKQEEDKYNKAIAQLQEDKAKVGNVTLGLNIPLLTASNLFQFGRLYANGTLNNARRLSGIKGTIGNYFTGKSKLGKAATILGGGLAEGSEEMSQSIASGTAQNYYAKDFNNYYRNLNNVNGNAETLDWIKSFGETLSANLSDSGTGGAWEEFAIGALTGLLGMPSFRGVRSDTGKWQSPVVLRENAVSKWKELSKEQKRNQAVVDYLNGRTQNSEEFKNYYQGISRHLNYQGVMDEAARRNDKFDYKNAEHAQLVSDIEMFHKAGRIEDLKTLIGDSFDTSDANIEAIIEGTKNDKEQSPYVDDKGNPLSKEEIVKKINTARQETLNTLDSYLTNRDKIDNATNQALSDENLNELTWMATQLDNWEERAGSMGNDIKTIISKVSGLLGQQKNAQELILAQEGQKSADLTEKYKEAEETIRSIDRAIKNLSLLQQLDGKTLANTLSKNKDVLEGISLSIDSIEDNVLSAEEKASAKTLLNDLTRIGEASTLYAKKYTEYLLNPQKQEEDHARVDAENANGALNAEKKERLTAAATASTFGDITSLIEEGKVANEDLASAPNAAAKEYNKAVLFRKKAIEAINNSDSDFKEQLLEMVESKFKGSSSYSDLINQQLEPDIPESALLLDGISQETLLNEFKNVLLDAAKKVKAGNSQKQDTGANPTGETKSTGNDGSSTIDEGNAKLNIDSIIAAIDALDSEDTDPKIKNILKQKVKGIANYLQQLKSDPASAALIHKLQNEISALKAVWNSAAINPLINEFLRITSANNREFSSQKDIAKEHEEEETQYPPTAVSGVLKTVIPQFDLDAKKNGVLIDFVSKDRNQGYAYVYNKLKEINPDTGKNAFDYVNEGNVKVGGEVEVRYEEATDEHPELLALYHNGILINYLNTDEGIAGVKEIKEKAKKGERTTVTITKIMDGSFGYNRAKMQSVADLIGSDTAYIGIATNVGTLTTNSTKSVEKHFGFSSSSTLGKVYLLLPNSKGTMTPKQVYIKHFNRDEYPLTAELKDTPVGKEILRILNTLSRGPYNTTLADMTYIALSEVFYLGNSFHFNIEDTGASKVLTIGYEDSKGNRVNKRLVLEGNKDEAIAVLGSDNSNAERFKENPTNIFNFVLNTLYDANLAFNISAKQLKEQGDEYANKLAQSHVLGTYLTSNRMQGSWLIFNEENPDSSRRDNAYDKKKAEEDKETGTSVALDGKQYYVKGSSIYYNGSIADLGDKAQQILDLAFIQEAYGDNLYGVNQHNGAVLIEDSKGKRGYSRRKNRYLTDTELKELETILSRNKTNAEKTGQAVHSLMEDQKRVVRDEEGTPDTSNNEEERSVYHIIEEDGNVHEYERIHTIIGSNYIGPSTGTAATSRGQVVDDFNRAYLNALKAGKEEDIPKPEKLSDKAFNTLKKACKNFYDYTRKYNFALVTDRVVVFNNYGGKRIAGELDVFAYNPITGDIVIFDFKTSKYSTRKGYDTIANPNYFTRSTKEQHTLQLSGYAKIIEDKYNVTVKNLVILPYRLEYGTDDSIAELYPEPYIGLTKNSNVFASFSTQSSNGTTKIQWYSERAKTYNKAEGKPIDYNGQTYYIMAANGTYAIVAPNGIVIGTNNEFESASPTVAASIIADFLSANVATLSEKLKQNPLANSPYGSSVAINVITKGEEKARKNADKLIDLQSSNSVDNNPVQDKKAPQPVITAEEDNVSVSQKAWKALSNADKVSIQESLGGIDINEASSIWDSLTPADRDALLGC